MSHGFTPLLALVAAVATSPPGAPSSAVVHIRNFAFDPPTVTLSVGSTLTIVNDDSEAHTATALDRAFDSAALDTNESWSHVFTKPGRHAYVCDLHPYMKGVVNVVRAAHSKGSS